MLLVFLGNFCGRHPVQISLCIRNGVVGKDFIMLSNLGDTFIWSQISHSLSYSTTHVREKLGNDCSEKVNKTKLLGIQYSYFIFWYVSIKSKKHGKDKFADNKFLQICTIRKTLNTNERYKRNTGGPRIDRTLGSQRIVLLKNHTKRGLVLTT